MVLLVASYNLIIHNYILLIDLKKSSNLRLKSKSFSTIKKIELGKIIRFMTHFRYISSIHYWLLSRRSAKKGNFFM